jgi:hypothetical protein
MDGRTSLHPHFTYRAATLAPHPQKSRQLLQILFIFIGLTVATLRHNIGGRDPDLEETTTIVDNTRSDKDAVLGALTNQLSYLCRFHKVSDERAFT